MLKCNTEIMKEIKTLEQDKKDLIDFERTNHYYTYLKGEEPIINGYNYFKSREDISKIDSRIRYLKGLLAYSNATTILNGFDMTIGEALIYLAQLNNEKDLIKALADNKQLTRTSVGSYANPQVQYTELEYDANIAKEDYKNITDKIYKLQLAIDRTNLTNQIEVSD